MDRLGELLDQHRILSGIICRDPTLLEIELLAQTGCHVVWIDLEHSSLSASEAVRLSRTIAHLGMVPLVRIIELSRGNVQSVLDGGFQIVVLPNVTDAREAADLVRLGKYPPLGQRGVSSTCAGNNYTLGDDPRRTLAEANTATHLMVMFESDQGFAQLDSILRVEGVDMVTVGPMDWAVTLELFGQEAKSQLAQKIDKVITAASACGKIVAMTAPSAEEARHYIDLGARVLFVGVDVALIRKAFAETLTVFHEVVQNLD